MSVAIFGNAIMVILTKYYSTDKMEYMIIPYLLTLLTTYAFLKVFQKGPTHILYSILVILTLMVAVVGSYFFLKEKISLINIAGIVVGFVAVYLLSK
jgi:multidrug transporter EmrE-like cation transporter